MYSIIASLHPGNEVRFSMFLERLPTIAPFPDDRQLGNDPPVNPVPGFPAETVAAPEPPPLTSCLDLRLNPTPENNTPALNRAVPFTRRKARDIKRRLEALGTIANPKECVMLTGTLPGSTMAGMSAIATLAPAIVKKIRRWVRHHCQSKYWLYTWEWQKRGALHIHYVIHEPDERKRSVLLERWQAKWTEILLSFGSEWSLCLFQKADGGSWLDDLSRVQAHSVALDKSPARYLSKYLSKSKYGKNGQVEGFYPPQWSGCSRELLALTASLTQTLRTAPMTMSKAMQVAEELKHHMESTEGKDRAYTHAGELFQTRIKYPATEVDKIGLWEAFQAELHDVRDVAIAPPPGEPKPLTEYQIEWHRRRDESLKRLSDRVRKATVEYWEEKYDYLGLRWIESPEELIIKENVSAIATGNANSIKVETGTPMGTVPVSPTDPSHEQLTLW